MKESAGLELSPSKKKLLIVVLYVDDLLITEPNEQKIADFKANLNKTFELQNLVISITTSAFNSLLLGHFLSQRKYIENLLQQFRFEECKPISTPA